jgi:hypothetical protein
MLKINNVESENSDQREAIRAKRAVKQTHSTSVREGSRRCHVSSDFPKYVIILFAAHREPSRLQIARSRARDL